MNLLKPLILSFTLLLISNTVQAQLLKQIEKRAIEAAKATILRKAEEEAAKGTEKTIDAMLRKKFKIGEKKSNRQASSNHESEEQLDEDMFEKYSQQFEDVNLPESYTFEWKYVMQMESEAYKKKQKEMGGTMMTYFLSTQSAAFATQFEVGSEKENLPKTLMIMDPTSGANIMLMEVDGEKIIQKMPSINDLPNEKEETSDYFEDAKIKKIGTKKIMGYTCQGFEMQLEEGVTIVYINPNAPVSFNRSGTTEFTPKGFDAEWLKEFENGLMMEMTFTSSKKPKQNMKMTCVELVREPLMVNLSEYKSFMDMSK